MSVDGREFRRHQTELVIGMIHPPLNVDLER
jgi:hypothetical protein